MSKDMPEEASRFIGSIPHHYDNHLGPIIFNDFADHIAQHVAKLNPTSVLELAAGTGIVTRRLRDALNDDCKLLATDLNVPMLEVAKEKFKPNEVVEFAQADALNLTFDAATFDTVVCQFGIMFFPDKARSYAEVKRILKPSGHYVFSVWGSWDENPFAKLVHDTIARFFPNNPPDFYKVPFSYHDVDEIRHAVQQSGFSDVVIEPVQISSPIASMSNFATGLVFGNPVHEEIVNRGGNVKEIHAAIMEAIQKKFGSEIALKIFIVQARC